MEIDPTLLARLEALAQAQGAIQNISETLKDIQGRMATKEDVQRIVQVTVSLEGRVDVLEHRVSTLENTIASVKNLINFIGRYYRPIILIGCLLVGYKTFNDTHLSSTVDRIAEHVARDA